MTRTGMLSAISTSPHQYTEWMSPRDHRSYIAAAMGKSSVRTYQAGAQGGPNRELAFAIDGARQKEIGDVHASRQQKQSNASREQQQKLPTAADHLCAHGNHDCVYLLEGRPVARDARREHNNSA